MMVNSSPSTPHTPRQFIIQRWHLGIVLVSALFIAWASIFIYRTSFMGLDGQRYFSLFDDAMISMRYAWNFSHGVGLVWNSGEYVEGVTNMLMTLYMSIGTFLFEKRIAVLFIQVSGIVFMLLIGWLTMKIAQQAFIRRGLQHEPLYLVLAFIAGFAYYPLTYFTLMGMETGLLTILMLIATWLILRTEGQLRPQLFLALILGLAFYTRPDTLIPTGILLAYRWIGIIGKPSWRRAVLTEGTILIALIGALTLFRVAYYGSPLPNTYYLKATGMPLSEALKSGLNFVTPFLKAIILPSAIALGCLVFHLRKHTALLVLLLAASIVYQIWIGGDAWNYWRIMAPYMPLLFVTCLESVRAFAKSVPARITPFITAIILCVSLYAANSGTPSFIAQITFRVEIYQVAANRMMVNTGLMLQKIAKPNATIAVLAAGDIPYYSGLRAIDMLGKSDAYIAHLPPRLVGGPRWFNMISVPGHNKYDLTYSILKLQPSWTEALKWYGSDVTAQAPNYQPMTYFGATTYLNTDSPDIDWEKVKEFDPAFQIPKR